MLQRIQSVFLALTGLMMFATIFTVFWAKGSPDGSATAQLTAFSLTTTTAGQVTASSNTIYLAVLGFVSAALAFGSAFQYKNRMFQIKLNTLNSLLMVVALVIVAFQYSGAQEMLKSTSTGGDFQSVGLGFYAIVIAIVSNMLANRFIKKDDALVRSADRIR